VISVEGPGSYGRCLFTARAGIEVLQVGLARISRAPILRQDPPKGENLKSETPLDLGPLWRVICHVHRAVPVVSCCMDGELLMSLSSCLARVLSPATHQSSHYTFRRQLK
jgi:hypothetical protein